MKNIEYSFIRAEKNNDIVLFVKVEPEWLDKDIYFGIEENKITVRLPNEEIYQSKQLETILSERLESQSTPVVFTDNEGNFLAEMKITSNNKRKVKP